MPSSFFGPRGALGSSFSSSFFFPPRSALSGFAGTGGPSGSGFGFSSGIDEILGWDGHPNFRTYLRIRSARAQRSGYSRTSPASSTRISTEYPESRFSNRYRRGPFDPRSIEALPADRPSRFGIAHRVSATFS